MTPQIRAVDPETAIAQQALHAYLSDVASRWHGRPVTAEELARAVDEHPVSALRPPYGVYLVALDDRGEPCGSAGLARIDEHVGEVQRLHVVARARGTGLGRRLMLEVESISRGWGLTRLRLDTRADLVESQALYRSLGFVESEPHSGGPYSDLWFAKDV